jgi:hypothetical protein
MLHISPKSCLKSLSHLGDPWMDRRSSFRVLELGLLCLRVVGSPPGARGRSARSWLTGCSSCSLCVLASSCFDPSSRGFSVARYFVDGPRGRCAQSLGRGRSAGRRQTIRFLGCATGGSGALFGLSALYLQTVRLSPVDGLPQSMRTVRPGYSRLPKSFAY